MRQGGELALSYFGGDIKQWDKKPGDPVSEADLAVDALLRERLCGARPDYAWLSEESEDDGKRLGAAATWIVDPIDGTRAFLDARPEFTVTAALALGSRIVSGAVFNPVTAEMFEAVAGGGARLNGEPMAVSDCDSLDGARLIAGPRPFRQRNWTEATTKASFHFVNSMAYRLALAATGRFDATLTLSNKSDWDIAAGVLLITEAGGRATRLDGSGLRLNAASVVHPDIVAGAPGLHKILVTGFAERPAP